MGKAFLVGTAVLVCSVLLLAGESRAQMRNPAGSDSPEHPTVQPGQDSAIIGSSGFKVPIPEIKMRRIVGDQPRRDTPPAKPKEEVRDRGKAPKTPGPEEIAAPPRVPRLPFEPPVRQPAGGPRKGPQKELTVPPKEPAQRVAEPDLPSLPPAEEVTDTRGPSVPPTRGPARGPVPQETTVPEALPPATPPPVSPAPTEHPSVEPPPAELPPAAPAAPPAEVEPEKTGPVSERTESPSPGREEGAHKESRPELLTPPQAPEDAVKPPPPPKKEILKQKPAPALPVLMKAPRSKEERKSMTVDRAETDEMADPRGWIKLDERREPEVIPPLEPEPEPETPPQPEVLPEQEPQALPETQPVPEPRPLTPPQPETLPRPEPEPQPEQQPIVKPEPQPVVQPEPAPSAIPKPEPMPVPERSPLDSSPKEPLPSEPGVEPPGGKETLPSVQEPPPVREVLPSPLQDDVLESWEVREYLKRAAPILEELSLLMTRAPSLAIADYDPSDPNAPAVPGDVHPKMESMRRTLTILDTKAFDIMPPKKYMPFHGLIRESITETIKACDAISKYLDSSKLEDLRGVQDHLIKARELIRQTRERTQRG